MRAEQLELFAAPGPGQPAPVRLLPGLGGPAIVVCVRQGSRDEDIHVYPVEGTGPDGQPYDPERRVSFPVEKREDGLRYEVLRLSVVPEAIEDGQIVRAAYYYCHPDWIVRSLPAHQAPPPKTAGKNSLDSELLPEGAEPTGADLTALVTRVAALRELRCE